MTATQHFGRRAIDEVSSHEELVALLHDAERAAEVLPPKVLAELQHLRASILHLTATLTDKITALEAQVHALRKPAKDATSAERALQQEIDRLRHIIKSK